MAKSDLTIAQIKEKRHFLAKLISEKIKEFEEETGVIVKEIKVKRVSFESFSSVSNVLTTVDINIEML